MTEPERIAYEQGRRAAKAGEDYLASNPYHAINQTALHAMWREGFKEAKS